MSSTGVLDRASSSEVDVLTSSEGSLPRHAVPSLSPRLQLVQAVLVLLFALSLSLVVQLTLVSSLQHRAAQGRKFDSFRSQLANGVAPIGPTTADGDPLHLGAEVALLEIRSIGVKEVVSEGTSSAVMFGGPGHRRDTPLPGQIGTSVIYGRAAAFGGPFSDLGSLESGDRIRVTTGQGVFDYIVTGVRREGDPVPSPAVAGSSRLLLATADGTAYIPNGVLRVDADLVGSPVGGPPRNVSSSTLPAPERAMAGDNRTLWALALWLQALIVVSVAAVWAWYRWGRARAWVVFLPVLLLVGLAASDEVARLLPNML